VLAIIADVFSNNTSKELTEDKSGGKFKPVIVTLFPTAAVLGDTFV
jgi:hypothetical protein